MQKVVHEHKDKESYKYEKTNLIIIYYKILK